MNRQEHIEYKQHILYQMDSATPTTDFKKRKYPPSSPRNRLLYLLMSSNEDETNSYWNTLKYLVAKDTGAEDQEEIYFEPTEGYAPPIKKRRRHTRRIVQVTDTALYESIGAGLCTSINCANPARTIYCDFREQLITDGIIRWRTHTEEMDICLMNDYHPSTGVLLPNSFVHVTSYTDEDDAVLKCTCIIYGLIQRCAKQGNELWPEDELIRDASLTCMHCRFYRENLLTAYDRCMEGNITISKPLEKVKESLQYINDPIQLVGSVLPSLTTKFSVKGEEDTSTVHVSFPSGRCYAKCMNGSCAANLRNKKKITKTVSLKEKDKLCPHIATISEHLDNFKSYFPDHFEGSPDEEEPVNRPFPDVTNTEDVNVHPQSAVHFDIDTGLWNFPALSKHKPEEEDFLPLVASTQQRNDFINLNNMNIDTGLYAGFKLIPSLTDKDCQCGAGYINNTQVYKFTSKLFTRNGVIECNCFDVLCASGTCTISHEVAAEEQCIFFYTKETCAGDEIGWDIISLQQKGHLSFTAFCNELTRRYRTTNISSRRFMSPSTMISWYFAWTSAFKIDFRKEVDPWCKHNPKVLACDGTHIGVSLRNMRLEKPITSFDTSDVKKPKHKRYDRVLIPDRTARQHLRYLSKKVLNKGDKDLSEEEEERLNLYLLDYVDKKCEPRIAPFIADFIHKKNQPQLVRGMARLLHLLSGDAALSTVAPFPAHGILSDACTDAHSDRRNIKGLEEVKQWSSEIADLVILGRRNNCLKVITDFIDSIIDRVKEVHADDDPAPQPVRQQGTYNPATGIAYYFTEHGEQVRQMPTYQVSGSSKNYDDRPQVDKPCQKIYPEVSYGGYGYLFLWFCPVHGHSYGFHMVGGGEGRKDPFCALYKYCEEMPQHVFYDFACQLSEYCLNREPDLFKNTRFWHDLFHLIGHLCGYNFKSGRVVGLEDLNTEICEQWNSVMQSIKYTASHLTQEHFVFYLQFHIHLVNRLKTKRFQEQAAIAVAGRM